MRLFERVRKLTVTQFLNFQRGATLRVERAGKVTTEITADEVASLAQADKALVAAAAQTLTAKDNGRTVYLNLAGGFPTILPAPGLGMRFRFVVATAPSGGSYTIATKGGANLFKGLVTEAEVDGGEDGPTSQVGDVISLVDSVAVPGDWVEVESDGTSWFFRGQTAADGAVTIAST